MRDFSNIVQKWLEFKWPEGTNPPMVRLDFARIGIQFQNRCSRAFVPCGMTKPNPDDPNGPPIPMIGLEASLKCWADGTDVPGDVPTIENIQEVARPIFKVPDTCTDEIVWMCVMAFVEELGTREQKKDVTPDSQGSPAVTQG